MDFPTKPQKNAFVDNLRAERQRRSEERKEKELNRKRDNAASVLQKWWLNRARRRKATEQCWSQWRQEQAQGSPTIEHCLYIVGWYCLLVRNRGQDTDSDLAGVCMYLRSKFRIDTTTSEATLTYHSLLIDARYRDRALDYLHQIVRKCLKSVCRDNTGDSRDMNNIGPELNTLLQYLNPKTFQCKQILSAKHLLDNHQELLRKTAQSVLHHTLLEFSVRESLTSHIQMQCKLEKRVAQYKSAEDTKALKAGQLWLTTMTRLCVFPLEFSVNEQEKTKALEYFILNILATPLITTAVNDMLAEHLCKVCRTYNVLNVLKKPNIEILENLDGNGCLFVIGSLMTLLSRHEHCEPQSIAAVVNSLLHYAQQQFSNQQTHEFSQYHPLFKWSRASWGNRIDADIFAKLVNQLEYLWSFAFVNTAFADVINFDRNPIEDPNLGKWSGGSFKLAANRTKLQQEEKSTAIAAASATINTVELSMDTESIFAMYSKLAAMLDSQKKEILHRIAFTPRLISQLWRVMNFFGPQGNMLIYLNAAQRQDGDVDKEPLVKILRMFCEACSLAFLTLDDTDIFEKENPFSADDLVKLAGFLNKFYFSLIQHSASAAQSFQAARRLLLQIHDLDTRHPFCPEGHWLLVSDPKAKNSFLSIFNLSNTFSSSSSTSFLEKLRQGDQIPLRILQLMPHTIPFETRLKVFRDFVALDKYSLAAAHKSHRIIRVRRQYILEDGYRGLGGLPTLAWKGHIQVKFVNELGVEEAGIDHGGPFKDFVSLLVSEIFKPSFGLFAETSHSRLFYPSPTSHIHGKHHVLLFEFVGKVIGKAIYEGILLDVQFASFVLAKLLGRNVFLEELRELDEDVWRNLTFLKKYDGDVGDLGLYFASDEQEFGKIVTYDLKYAGRAIPVTNESKIDYIYRMADFKLNARARDQTKAFIRGFQSVIADSWIKMFSPPELQRVISGEDTDFDVADLRRHTEYQNGYFDQHPTVRALWQIVQDFNSEEKRAFLKFVTSCPKPPLGGFDYLQPPFTVRMVPVDGDARQGTVDGIGIVKTFFKVGSSNNESRTGRLPTSSTCFNLLKLPAYTKKSILKEKLRYAIHSNSGFELS